MLVSGPMPSARLNDFFVERKTELEYLERCLGCEAPGPFPSFMIVKGAKGSEGEGVWMPSVRCTQCGLVFLNPRIPGEGAAAFFEASQRLLSYFTSGQKGKVDESGGFAPFARLIERNIGPAERSLYDIGCGAGAFLREMAKRGFNVAGAELSPSVAEAARSRFHLDVSTADADKAITLQEQAGRRFGVVSLIHTFEHLPDPLRVLKRIRSILQPNGLLAINVPNVKYFLVPVDRLLRTNTAGIWDSVSHYTYFSQSSLAVACQKAGYEVVDTESRLLVSGRRGIVGGVDEVVSRVLTWIGGRGSNIAVLARLRAAGG
jgi:SAM-dependent methyltransferase